MDDIQQQAVKLLQGHPLPVRPLHPSLPTTDFIPITKRTVCYIVAGIVFNDKNEVLMMREAKSSCYGRWYLPAGRMEPNETIQMAVQREVEEETGVTVDPITLLAVEMARSTWIRFTMLARTTGGTLKTPAMADKESLEARWLSWDEIKDRAYRGPSESLRATDILPLIEIALKHREAEQKHTDLSPLLSSHKQLLLNSLIVHCDASGQYHLLVDKSGGAHLPSSAFLLRDYTAHQALMRLLKTALKFDHNINPVIFGVLGVEYDGRPAGDHDGFCLSLLITVSLKDGNRPEAGKSDDFEWFTIVDPKLQDILKHKMQPGMTIPFISL